jgi:hypothetical protein
MPLHCPKIHLPPDSNTPAPGTASSLSWEITQPRIYRYLPKIPRGRHTAPPLLVLKIMFTTRTLHYP